MIKDMEYSNFTKVVLPTTIYSIEYPVYDFWQTKLVSVYAIYTPENNTPKHILANSQE